MQVWLDTVGELPARRAAPRPRRTSPTPLYAPFINALPYSHTTIFVDEKAQRQDPDRHGQPRHDRETRYQASIAEAAKADQALLDRFYKK